MMNDPEAEVGQPPDFSLMLGGPLYRVYLRAQLARPPLELLHRRIIALVLIAWLPLLALTILADQAVGGVKTPFLEDLASQTRFLIALPLLLVGELFVHQRLRSAVGQFLERGLIERENQPRFEAVVASALRWRDSAAVEALL